MKAAQLGQEIGLCSTHTLRSSRFIVRFLKFCIVGASGVIVDMAVLCLLADPRFLGLNVSLSKVISAETALINNFLWNEPWTFKQDTYAGHTGWLRRLLKFNTICGIGIVLSVCLLYAFHYLLSFNLYLSNFLAIILVTLWNFFMNSLFNWRLQRS